MRERVAIGGPRAAATGPAATGATARTVSPTLALPRASGEPLPSLYSHGVLKYYAHFVHVALRLREPGGAVQNAPVLRQELHRRIGEASAFYRAEGAREEDVQLAELAVAAMLDSAALAGSAAVRAAWSGETLEQQRFGSEIAGERFFVAYGRLLGGERPELLELFVWALRTGFSGGRGAAELTALLHQGEELLSRAGRASAPLYVPAVAQGEPQRARPSLPRWALPAMSALFFGVLLALISVMLYAQAGVVGRELAELAARIGGAQP